MWVGSGHDRLGFFFTSLRIMENDPVKVLVEVVSQQGGALMAMQAVLRGLIQASPEPEKVLGEISKALEVVTVEQLGNGTNELTFSSFEETREYFLYMAKSAVDRVNGK